LCWGSCGEPQCSSRDKAVCVSTDPDPDPNPDPCADGSCNNGCPFNICADGGEGIKDIRYSCIRASSIQLSNVAFLNTSGGNLQYRIGNFRNVSAITTNGDVNLGNITITVSTTATNVNLPSMGVLQNAII
jgi:hypothetical protein